MRFLLNLLDLLISLPWWASISVVVLLVVFFLYVRHRFFSQMEKIIHEGILEAGAALKDAQATVHAVTAAPAPAGASPYDIKEDDEEFCEEIDGQPWDDEDASFYSIDVTITPADATAKWDPTGLAAVPADFEPEDPTDCCEKMCGLHSAEQFVSGHWEPTPEREIQGPRRLKLLMGVPDGVRALKFANMVTYFGHVDLPAPLPKTRKSPARR